MDGCYKLIMKEPQDNNISKKHYANLVIEYSYFLNYRNGLVDFIENGKVLSEKFHPMQKLSSRQLILLQNEVWRIEEHLRMLNKVIGD